MRILDLFAGEGGASKGYQDAGFHVTAVEMVAARLRRNPADVTVHGDALEYVRHHGAEYDAIHASPPCQGYSIATAGLADRSDRYDRLIAVTRDALIATGRPYVIENVYGARHDLIDPVRLCGSHFGLTATDTDGTPLRMERHRLFEAGRWVLPSPGPCHHDKSVQVAGAYGGGRADRHEARYVRRGGYTPCADVRRQLLRTPWMTMTGANLSIPPVYAEYVGIALAKALREARP